MLDDDRPPPLKERLLHPFPISAIIAVVAVGGYWGRLAYEDMKRAALMEALEPLEAEWQRLAAAARPRLARVESVLADAPAAAAQPCQGVEGTVEVVHRPVMEALAAGESFPNIRAPYWLSSDAYRELAGSMSPGMSVENYQRRNERVAEALARPCVGVLETERAEQPQMNGETQFDGGGVAGWLRVVCLTPARVEGQARVLSQPWLAVAFTQDDEWAQAGANSMAIDGSASASYWLAVEQAMAEACPGVKIHSHSPRADGG